MTEPQTACPALGPLRTVRAIVGPTGAGKSALALELAMRVRAAIISADSRQLYRGFDIGTAKPTATERAAVPHYGIDVAEPAARWSAARWAEAAETWIADSEAAGRAPLLVGGTGFYLRALAAPLFAEPPLDPDRRPALARELGALSIEVLRARVAAIDPTAADAPRAQLLRAAEVMELTGVPLGVWQRTASRPPRFALRYLVVDPGAALAARLERRTDAMLAAGWLAEVERLARDVPADAPAWHATGYDSWRAYLNGELSFAAARERVVIATRQYAKRQRTWFRHQLPPASVTIVDPTHADAGAIAAAWWSASDDALVPASHAAPSSFASRPTRA